MEVITFRKISDEYGWMSNMSAHRINHTTSNGYTFDCGAEALFQGLRLPVGSSYRAKVLHQTNPMVAKRVAKEFSKHFVFNMLSQVDEILMMYTVFLKLKSNPELIEKLREIPTTVTIIEDVSYRIGDNKSSSLFWGMARIGNNNGSQPHWVGKNMLGVILKEIKITHLDNMSEIISILEDKLIKLKIL